MTSRIGRLLLSTAALLALAFPAQAQSGHKLLGGPTGIVKSAYVSPGVRWSYDFDSGLQIVPGIAFPIGVGPSRHEKSVFLYLSFEHPFKK